MLNEATIRFSHPITLGLVALTILTVWKRSRIGGTLMALFWAISAVDTFVSTAVDDVVWHAIQEGCRGHVDLFIGLSAAICIATLYVVWRPRKTHTSGD
jgi:hypothetical protein